MSDPVVAASSSGIRNFDRVDARVYRGGQPTADGFRYLAGIGVKTVIDLRRAGVRSRAEQHVVTGDGMRYLNVPMSGLTPPTRPQIDTILNLLEAAGSGPVFVHCLRGADRTGAVIAAYHIDHDHWDNGRALRDARRHGMGLIQVPRERYIAEFHPRPATVSPPSGDAAVGAAGVKN